MQIQKKQPSSPFIIWATGKMQYNKTRSIEGRYRFWEFAVSVYMVWCTMQWSGFEGIGFGSSLYRFPCFQGINTNKDLLWKDFCMNLFACCSSLLSQTLAMPYLSLQWCWKKATCHSLRNWTKHLCDRQHQKPQEKNAMLCSDGNGTGKSYKITWFVWWKSVVAPLLCVLNRFDASWMSDC